MVNDLTVYFIKKNNFLYSFFIITIKIYKKLYKKYIKNYLKIL